MPGAERDADLTVDLGAADAGAVAGAGVDHDERTLVRVGGAVGGRPDAHEGVVCRVLEGPSVHNHIVIEDEDGRLPFFFML